MAVQALSELYGAEAELDAIQITWISGGLREMIDVNGRARYDSCTMASDSGGDPDSWPGFLSELTKSFLILRDIFGYALPGAVFLSIGVLCRRFSLVDVQNLLRPYQLPAWLALIVVLAACYTVGHLMAQVAYFFSNTWGFPWSGKKAGSTSDGKPEKTDPRLPPYELLNLREDHPVLLTEYDRQSIMTQLRGSTGAAMLVGCLVFYVFPTPPIGLMAGTCGLFLLLVFWFSALPHMKDLEQLTKEAGKAAEAADPQLAGDAAKPVQAAHAPHAAAEHAHKKH
jgi:hypothetical protein